MEPKFSGILEKLKRTHESIRNLKFEIDTFFQSGEYPVLPEEDKQLLLKAIEYHKKRVIPLRFSVLAGEIIHHLRSCLDHLIWEISEDGYRKKYYWKIEFPVLEVRPNDKNDIARYEAKIKGVTDSRLRNLIGSLQPYKAPDPIECPLLILHKLDVIDKHRELVLVAGTGAREIAMNTVVAHVLAANDRRITDDIASGLAIKLKGYGKLVPQIAFRDFGRRAIQPVVPGLEQLNNYTVGVLKRFDP